MIIKGASRAAPKQLAKHLLRADTNERVEILELQSPHDDLHEALRDWQFLSEGTRGTKGLYHANIDPAAHYEMTAEQWQRTVDVLEKELGFEGQPRAVVLHEKHGRQHIHVVWSRTDLDTMTLITDSWNYRAHEVASMALEQEFGHEHVPGKHVKRDREKQPELPKAEFNHAEWQQAERDGLDPRDRKDAVTKLYEQSDSGSALKAALEEAGYVLAKGDRRDFVIVDQSGQIHSLGRQIEGVKAKDLREFMSDIDREKLPSAEQAKTQQRRTERQPERQPEQARAASSEPAPAQSEPLPEPPPPAPDKHALSSDEISAMERAVAERHAEESRKLILNQTNERTQTAAILKKEIEEKVAAFDAVQGAKQESFLRQNVEKHSDIAGMFGALKDFFKPEQAAKEAAERDNEVAAFNRGLETERAERIDILEAGMARDLAELDERHAQQRSDHEASYQDQLARYLREEELAKRLLFELEEERRRQLEEARSRDGPERPPPSAR